MNLIVIITVLFGHWLSDFVLQKNKKKKGRGKIKNKNIKHILPHTLIYSMVLTVLVSILQILNLITSKYLFGFLLFFIITYITHFITDFCVTKVNEKHLKNNKRHKLLVSIGFDQFLHGSILFITLELIYKIIC